MNETLFANMQSQVENDPNISVCEISSDIDVSVGTVYNVSA